MAAIGLVSPALVLMDVRIPGIGEIQATREIVDRYPKMIVMLMSTNPTKKLPNATQACNAAAFLRKEDLRPRMLRDVWEMHQEARAQGAGPLDADGQSTRDRPSS